MDSSSEVHINSASLLAATVTTTESKSVSLVLRRFETCRQVVFSYIGTGHSRTEYGFVVSASQLALAKWLPQRNQNLFLLDCVGSKPAEDQVFSIETHIDTDL